MAKCVYRTIIRSRASARPERPCAKIYKKIYQEHPENESAYIYLFIYPSVYLFVSVRTCDCIEIQRAEVYFENRLSEALPSLRKKELSVHMKRNFGCTYIRAKERIEVKRASDKWTGFNLRLINILVSPDLWAPASLLACPSHPLSVKPGQERRESKRFLKFCFPIFFHLPTHRRDFLAFVYGDENIYEARCTIESLGRSIFCRYTRVSLFETTSLLMFYKRKGFGNDNSKATATLLRGDGSRENRGKFRTKGRPQDFTNFVDFLKIFRPS